MLAVTTLVLTLAARVAAHGYVSSPEPRALGQAAIAACGKGVTDEFALDRTAPVEYGLREADDGYSAEECAIFLCRGYKHEDNVNNTRVLSPGSEVNFKINLSIRHTGVANVSVIDLANQTPIARLYTWDVYANDTLSPTEYPEDETNFMVTIPDLGDQCATPGACAIQWWWYGTQVKQTYESCVDFTTESVAV